MSQDQPKPTAGRSWRFIGQSDGAKVELHGNEEFDELFVAPWLHIERMRENYYWMRIGDLKVEITLDGGRVKSWISSFES